MPITRLSSSCNTSPGAKFTKAPVVLTTTAVVLVAVSVPTCTVPLKSRAPFVIAAIYKSCPTGIFKPEVVTIFKTSISPSLNVVPATSTSYKK